MLHISPLLRELIIESVRIGRLRFRNPLERAFRDVIICQIEHASPVPTFVKLPSDPRALTVAKAVIENPAASNAIPLLCSPAGVSVRTIQRLFLKEVGMDFESWRRQVRLVRAIELLVNGSSVKEVSFAVGYRQTSAFVESFRRTFGTTPKVWITGLEKLS